MHFSAEQTEKPILFYEGDWDLLLVSRFREVLASGFRFVIADSQLVEDLVDKARFVELVRDLDLPAPHAQRLSFASGAASQVLQLGFPVVVKPLTRQRATWRSIAVTGTAQEPKAVRVDDEHEMRRLWPRLTESGLDVLVQELVPGPESRIESWHAYADATGKVVASFTGKKIRTLPATYGYSSALEITANREVASLGADLMARIGLTGVVKFDFKRDDHGRLYLLGINLPALVYSDLTGTARPDVTDARAGVQWCRYRRDVRAAKAAGVPFLRWLAWSLSCEAKSPSLLDDPMPVIRGALWSRLARPEVA
jgi:predicted ATP-grasp superfamily ATP-dependent carboligase